MTSKNPWLLLLLLLAVHSTSAAADGAKPLGTNERMVALLRGEDPLSDPTLAEVLKVAASVRPANLWPSTLSVLNEKKCFADADRLAKAATLGTRYNPDYSQGFLFLAQYQPVRVRALLGLGRVNEALEVARGYYNVCALKDTSGAVELLATALAAAHQDDPEIAYRFKVQQTAGASTQPSQPDRTQNAGSSILNAIAIDPAPYQATIDSLQNKTDFASLTARGSFLLLAGRCAEAREVFNDALDLAQDRDLPNAIENVAKVIRAETGNVGPANDYILQLRDRGVAKANP